MGQKCEINVGLKCQINMGKNVKLVILEFRTFLSFMFSLASLAFLEVFFLFCVELVSSSGFALVDGSCQSVS